MPVAPIGGGCASVKSASAGVTSIVQAKKAIEVFMIGERLHGGVLHDEAGVGLLDGPGRREAAARHLRAAGLLVPGLPRRR
jgi:hypothetical protein